MSDEPISWADAFDGPSAWAVVSDGPGRKPDISIGSFYGCVTAGPRIAGVTNSSSVPFWVDAILLGHDRYEIRPRLRVSPGCTAWVDLDGWPEPPLSINPEAFAWHVLSSPMGEWMRDTGRQDLRRIFGTGRG